MSIKTLLALLLGGGLGTVVRYWLGMIIPFTVTEFAWATFFANMAGCFAIGGCYPFINDPVTRIFLMAGVLGGITTFSGFGLEVLRYTEAGQWKIAMVYGLSSLILGTILVYLGYRLGQFIK